MDTRTKILNSAQRLIQTRTFHGFSFQDIADEVGIRKASLYHHFGSKDDVALAMLKRAKGWVASQFEQAAEKEPVERLDLYFDMFRPSGHKGLRMCPNGSFGAVIDVVSRPIQRAVQDFGKLHLDWLERTVREGAEQGQFAIGDRVPRDAAVEILVSIQGALLTGRALSDPQIFETTVAQLRSYLGYVPKAAQQRARE